MHAPVGENWKEVVTDGDGCVELSLEAVHLDQVDCDHRLLEVHAPRLECAGDLLEDRFGVREVAERARDPPLQPVQPELGPGIGKGAIEGTGDLEEAEGLLGFSCVVQEPGQVMTGAESRRGSSAASRIWRASRRRSMPRNGSRYPIASACWIRVRARRLSSPTD